MGHNGYMRLENVPLSTNKSGYLFKKGTQRVIQSWTKRYFTIEGEYLTSCIRNGKVPKDDEDSLSINLRVCHIKPAPNSDRRFCFEIISPMRTYVLQAENQEEMDDWIHCLQTAAKEALYADQTPSPVTSGVRPFNEIFQEELENVPNEDGSIKNHKKTIQQIMDFPGNQVCVDCKSPDPQWASTNFGTLLCIECSGIHRSLGVHVSKVRSLTLDKWEPEAIEVMLKLGNENVNRIYEAQLDDRGKEWTGESEIDRTDREKFIVAKYVKKQYVSSPDEANSYAIHLAFWEAMSSTDLCQALKYLSLGANVDCKNEAENSTTPLHQAILRSDDVAVEFLLQWFCDLDAVDRDGWSALHHAAAMNNARLLLNLMKRHATITLKDKNDKAPVDIALEKQHVQAVTALRLFQFESQLTRSEYSTFGVDEALTSVSKPSYRTDPGQLNLRISTSAPATPPASSRPNSDDAISVRTSVDTAVLTPPTTGISKFSLSSLKLPNFGPMPWDSASNDSD